MAAEAPEAEAPEAEAPEAEVKCVRSGRTIEIAVTAVFGAEIAAIAAISTKSVVAIEALAGGYTSVEC